MPARFLIVPVITDLDEEAEGYVEVDDADWPRRQINRIVSAVDTLPFSREGWLYASDAHPELLSDQRLPWSEDEETIDAAAFEALWTQATAQEAIRSRLPYLEALSELAQASSLDAVSPTWPPELVGALRTLGQTTSLQRPVPEVERATQKSVRTLAQAAAAVHDRPSFAAFVEALADDRFEAEREEQQHRTSSAFEPAHGWQTRTLPAYLWALARELEATPTETIDWGGLAQVLVAAKGRRP